MNTLVLGCGPAGLFAAHAVKVYTGKAPHIIAKPPVRRSEMYGAQYLHQPIPMTLHSAGTEPVRVSYDLWGDVDDYRQKVYGDNWNDNVSPEDLLAEHDAWDIRATYNELWEQFWDYIAPLDLARAKESDLATLFARYDLVINTIPKPVLCRVGHQFRSEQVWAIGDAPERGVRCPVRVAANTVVCNGEPEPGWYRAANVMGYCTVEYPGNTKPPWPGSAEVTKPLSNNCDCWPGVLHIGRYGMWQKGILSHSAFGDTAARLLA